MKNKYLVPLFFKFWRHVSKTLCSQIESVWFLQEGSLDGQWFCESSRETGITLLCSKSAKSAFKHT